MTSARWDEGKFDTYLPPDLRTDEEIEEDEISEEDFAYDEREDAAYQRIRDRETA